MTSHEFLLWVGFAAFVLPMLALDLFLNRKSHAIKTREALLWSAFWIAVSLIFNAVVFLVEGSEKGLQFLAGYIIEKSLSVDNLFVFLLIFTYFSVPERYQHRALYAGVLGAIIMRGVFIAAGIALINLFNWILYIFGAFLIFTGIRMAVQKQQEIHPERNPVLRLARRFLRVTDDYVDHKLFVRKNGILYATPLFIVLLVIETTDVVFAVDSIPAIIGITQDTFIVFSSNIFAILGLRALYFALAGLRHHFRLLHYGLAFILVFIGGKMISEQLPPPYTQHIAIELSLAVVGVALLVAALASIIVPARGETLQTSITTEKL